MLFDEEEGRKSASEANKYAEENNTQRQYSTLCGALLYLGLGAVASGALAWYFCMLRPLPLWLSAQQARS